MRLHFQAVPWDLYAATAFSVVVSVSLLATGTGNPFGILLVVFVPGYLATVALLPRKDDGDSVFRLALCLGLSIALAAFAGLTLNYAPWGISVVSAVLAVLVLSLLLAGVAYARRMTVPPAERLELSATLRWGWWAEYTFVEKILAIVLVIILAVTVPFLGIALMKPPATQPFTELYLLGPTGDFTGYPSRLNVSQPGTLQVVVSNHEATTVNYTVRVDLVGVRIVYDPPSGTNRTIELNRTTWSQDSRTVGDGDAWTRPYTFSIPAAGTWEVQFLLYRNGDLTTLYRKAALLVTVP